MGNRAAYRLSLRLSAEESKMLSENAEKCGLSRSAYLRRLITGRRVKAKPPKELHVLYTEINRIGNNINQIARSVNAGIATPEDATTARFREEIRTLEAGLEKLEVSEAKYAAELENALKQYAELKAQAAEFEPVELYKARQAIRPEHERSAIRRTQEAYSKKYDLFRMYESEQNVVELLQEEAEERAAREKLRAIQKERKAQQQKVPIRYEPER